MWREDCGLLGLWVCEVGLIRISEERDFGFRFRFEWEGREEGMGGDERGWNGDGSGVVAL